MVDYRSVHGNHSVERYIRQMNSSSMSERLKKDILQFVDDLRIGKAGKKVKDRRIESYLQFLVHIHKILNKDFDKLTEDDTTTFYKNLYEDKYKKQNNMPYSLATKDMFIKSLKRYLGWKIGNQSRKYKKLVGWMKEDYKKSDKKAIDLEQANLCLEKEKNLRNQCLFMFLFDSGARIEEALNVRLKDLTLSKKKTKGGKYYMVYLRGTKTEESERNISLPLCKKYINAWLEDHPTKNQEDFLFPIQYDNSRKIIRLMSTKVLGFSLAPHELRHSSATYYVQQFGADNIGGFYYRYGWKFGSKVAEGYIKKYLFGGEVGQSKVVNSVEADRVEKLESELAEMKDAFKAFAEKMLEAAGDKEDKKYLLEQTNNLFS